MDFSLSEEQQDVRALAAQILGREVTVDKLNALDEQGGGFSDDLWEQLGQAGLLGVAIDEAYGGMGFDFETLCLLVEEAGKTVAPVPLVPVLVSAAFSLQQSGSAEQRARWLQGIASGDRIVTAALTEPQRSDPLLPRTSLVASGGQWSLSGSKDMVAWADRAAGVLLSAQCGGELVLLLVDPHAEGVNLLAQQVTTGEVLHELVFSDAVVADADIVARGDAAITAVAAMVDATLAANSVRTLGVVQSMLNMTAQYTIEREQFGRPIATFQAVSHRAADAYIDVESLRLVCQQAVSLIRQGQDAAEAVTIAKIWASDVAHRVSQSAQHLHGGVGVDRDYPLYRYCLLAKQLELTLGGGSAYLAELGDLIAETVKARVA